MFYTLVLLPSLLEGQFNGCSRLFDRREQYARLEKAEAFFNNSPIVIPSKTVDKQWHGILTIAQQKKLKIDNEKTVQITTYTIFTLEFICTVASVLLVGEADGHHLEGD